MGYSGLGAKLNIDNKKLFAEIIQSKKQNSLTPELIDYFIKLANHAIRQLTFTDPRDREDCIQSALFDLIKYWRDFDRDKSSNAFAYFTQMAKNGYAKQFKQIYRYRYLKRSQTFSIGLKENVTFAFLINETIEIDEIIRYLPLSRYVRMSKNNKNWSKWILIGHDRDCFETVSSILSDEPLYVQFKYEYTEDIETLSLSYEGDSEIYTI